MDLHDWGYAVDAGEGGDIPDEIVIEVLVGRRVNHIVRADGEQRVTIGRRAHHGLGRDIAAGARPVLDDELLTEPLRQPLTHDARGDVERLAGDKSDDHAHRARRVSLRPGNAAYDRERSSARDQLQKLSAGKLHVRPCRNSMTLNSTDAVVRAQAQPSRQSCRRSLKTIDIAELPDWLAAAKRIDTAATFHPA